MVRDRMFSTDAHPGPEQFEFDGAVAAVFDDMAGRSVPGYGLLQDLLVDLALRCHRGEPIYDLGCATGTTLAGIGDRSPEPVTLVGVDRSAAMLEQARAKLAPLEARHSVVLEERDIADPDAYTQGPAGVVVMCLTLQFVRPLERPALLETVARNLAPGGHLLLVEKTVEADPGMNTLLLDAYHGFKAAQGYTETEIARKREAYHNRLVPFRPQENATLLGRAGFDPVAVFFACLNFQGYVARRPAG